MKLALIPPVHHFHFALRSHFHLVLSHVMDDPDIGSGYTARYSMLDKKAHYVILDNGAHENPSPDPLETTLRLAQRLRAQEVVMPDVQQDEAATVTAVTQAADWLLTDHGIDVYQEAGSPALMYVPQGESLGEWASCLKRLLLQHGRLQGQGLFPEQPVIGLAKKHAAFFPYESALRLLETMTANLAPIHLLGWPADVDVSRLTVFPAIRSIDTAKPFTMAMAGMNASDCPYPWASNGRPEGYFRRALATDQERVFAEQNIATFLRACEGRI